MCLVFGVYLIARARGWYLKGRWSIDKMEINQLGAYAKAARGAKNEIEQQRGPPLAHLLKVMFEPHRGLWGADAGVFGGLGQRVSGNKNLNCCTTHICPMVRTVSVLRARARPNTPQNQQATWNSRAPFNYLKGGYFFNWPSQLPNSPTTHGITNLRRGRRGQ